MLLLGYDIGSSSIKGAILDAASGRCLASAQFPETEMAIDVPQPGHAEQSPEQWWQAIRQVTLAILSKAGFDKSSIGVIGISYQMHGLVIVDKNLSVLRPAIIWCDSRAVEIGQDAFERMGSSYCLEHLLNSPGNFTASKLKWVKENEPDIYDKIYKAMLPGEYIAMRLTGEVVTTISGLSEGIFWDFKSKQISSELLENYGIEPGLLPQVLPVFSEQGCLMDPVAKELGLTAGIPVSYRAGDQINNALSLNVLAPGELAATAGTSGVVYGISEQIKYDELSRVNSFAHVNYSEQLNRLGILLCINGSGILYSWASRNLRTRSYSEMNALVAASPPGAKGISVLPFGNGAERMLGNRNIGAHFSNINFNVHTNADLLRGMLEGIVFSFRYGMEIMAEMGLPATVIRAGMANLFLSEVFRKSLATATDTQIELYNTDGAQGAARGAGIGIGYYNFSDAFAGLAKIEHIEPWQAHCAAYEDAYQCWKKLLLQHL